MRLPLPILAVLQTLLAASPLVAQLSFHPDELLATTSAVEEPASRATKEVILED